jgi:hypothetical protein
MIVLLFSVIAQAQIVNIPDANFKNALVNNLCVDADEDGIFESDVDINNDGEIQVSEAELVIKLKVEYDEISSLEGIQSFSNLKSLQCKFNELTSLDLSQNPDLEILTCYRNQLTNLNVSQNPNLIILSCGNNQLTNLDVTQNPNLRILYCRVNQISHLNVSQNFELEELRCSLNQLTSIDVTQNQNLKLLGCSDNQLTSLNINNGNNPNIDLIYTKNNPNLFCISVDDFEYANNQICNETDWSWCKDIWTEYSEECILGIPELNSIGINIFPNPVKDVLYITSETPFDILKIYNLQGQLINETKNNQIDVSLFSSGLYFTSIVINGKNIVKKFIKD